MDNDVQLAVYIDADTKADLEKLKRTEGIGINAFIRLAITERLERLGKERSKSKRR